MSSPPESPSSPSSSRSSSPASSVSDEPTIRIKTEDGTDEVKVFSASTNLKKEIEDDVDVDGIEDRLSPVVEEPVSPTKAEPSTIPNLYPPPFLYPYFHPMWNPYLMAAAAQAQTPGASSSMNKDPFPSADGFPPGPFGGVPFPPGLYPSAPGAAAAAAAGMSNSPFQPNLFNPFGIPIPTPGLRPAGPSAPKDLNSLLESKRPRKPHIKKPLNAFMIYMKEQRAKVIEECTLKESSAINKVLGQKWKELSRAEQDRYYELAKEERNRHMQLYPGWSARDNYGLKKKRTSLMPSSSASASEHSQKKFIREHHQPSPHKSQQKSSNPFDNDCAAAKKCRARYGLEGLNQWCKHCRRKKKCTRFLEDDSNGNFQTNVNGNPSSVSSPGQSDNDESINDLDSDDILARQIDAIDDDEQENSDEENQHHHQVQRTHQFYPGFSY